MNAYEWDRTTMAVVACALANDSDGAGALLEPLDARDLRHVVVRLAAMAAEALVAEADDAGGDREEVIARWRASILAHESRHDAAG
ncbi:hypothetical protein [Streptomyces zagrosensis]|uniref:Uncharacterized protein n=1 Tax=Streptomyces zagrosensis TaxID=1042984 RepID=A0A7W9QFX7_9ACTN|nr:hypothetical protein [Streptomyces zagrosensis]MBB5938487.1 hypothetical protein [Streptomyces zagrosensis]